MCVFYFVKTHNHSTIYFEEREVSLCFVRSSGPHVFQHIYKNVIKQRCFKIENWWKSFLNLVFKHPKISNVIQTLQ